MRVGRFFLKQPVTCNDELIFFFLKEHAGHATEVMRSLDLSAWYGVVIVSGDGLIYEVL